MALLTRDSADAELGGGLQPELHLDVLTPAQLMYDAATRETPIGQYLGESFKQGFDESLLGRAVEEVTTPPRAATSGAATSGIAAAARTMRPPTPPEREQLSEEDWKASPHFRTDIPYSPTMTEDRAAAIADSYDRRRWRDGLYERYQGGLGGQALGLAAQFAGAATDPVNYVPVLGPATRAYAVGRLGTLAGYAATTAADAAINSALVAPLIYGDLAARGEDVGVADVALDVALSGLAGGLFGLGGGALARRRVARAMNRPAAARQLEALNAAVDSVARDEPVDVGPIIGGEADRLLTRLSEKRQVIPPRDTLDRAINLWQQGRQWPEAKATAPSLLAFLRRQGGLKDSGGELAARDLPKMRPGLVSGRGRSLDDAALSAWQAGYIGTRGGERPSLDELLSAIDEELGGSKRFPEGSEPGTDYVALVDEEIGRLGIVTEGKSPREIKEAILAAHRAEAAPESSRTLDDLLAEDAELDEYLSMRDAEPRTLEDLDSTTTETPEPPHPSITEAEARLPLMQKSRSELDGLARDMGLGDSLDDIPELEDVEVIRRHGGGSGRVLSYQTSQGSFYDVDSSGRTARVKSLHKGHDPKDVGQKERSEQTIYVSPEDARRIGMHGGLSGRKTVLVRDGNVALLSWNDAQGRWGMTAEDRAAPIAFSEEPDVGRAPLELWRGKDEQGGRVFGKWHPGNEITSVTREGAGSRITADDEAELAAADEGAKAAQGYADAYETLGICVSRFAA